MTTSSSDPADALLGKVIADRYRIEERLGRGGMGEVYRAHHLALDRSVAIKVLHTHLTEDPLVAKRFDREALAASKLDHPNCVQMIDAGTMDSGTKYLVMQLLEGKELAAMLDAPMPFARAVDIAKQILQALEHAHRRGIVHRDLKPENIFVVKDDDDRDVIKLVDFGIVKLLSSTSNDEKLTRAGLVFGTPRYMSPEQASGGAVDERTDLYALGVMLYEMIAGKPPFEGDGVSSVLRMHLLADPPPLPDFLPEDLRAVVMRLLAKSPKNRYESARETREALEAVSTTDANPSLAAVSVAAAISSTTHEAGSAASPTADEAGAATSPTVHEATFGVTSHATLWTDAGSATAPSNRARWMVPAVVAALSAAGILVWVVVAARDGADRGPSRSPSNVAGATSQHSAATASQGEERNAGGPVEGAHPEDESPAIGVGKSPQPSVRNDTAQASDERGRPPPPDASDKLDERGDEANPEVDANPDGRPGSPTHSADSPDPSEDQPSVPVDSKGGPGEEPTHPDNVNQPQQSGSESEPADGESEAEAPREKGKKHKKERSSKKKKGRDQERDG